MNRPLTCAMAVGVAVSLVVSPAHAYEDLSVAPWATETTQPTEPAAAYHFQEGFRAPDEWVLTVDVVTGELSAWLLTDTPEHPTVQVPVVSLTDDASESTTIVTVSADLPEREGSSAGWQPVLIAVVAALLLAVGAAAHVLI